MKQSNYYQNLKEYQIEDWVKVRKGFTKQLPTKLRNLANQMIDVIDQVSQPNMWLKQREHNETFGKLLNGIVSLSRNDSDKFFKALFPALGGYISQALAMLETTPYQMGYYRKGFRSGGNLSLEELHIRKQYWIRGVLMGLIKYEEDIIWLAAWSSFVLGDRGPEASLILAAALNEHSETSQKIEQILKDITAGEHEIGILGHDVIAAFLLSDNEALWEYVANLLRTAQRQEGLRQAILECADFAHPGAFVKILQIIVNENMTRFSSVVRALDVWLGFQLESAQQKEVQRIVQTLLELLTNEDFLKENLTEDDPEMLYMALWAIAFRDVERAVEQTKDFVSSQKAEIRFVVYLLLGHFGISLARPYFLTGLADENLQVAVTAFTGLNSLFWSESQLEEFGLFEKLEPFFTRLPKQLDRAGLVWPWTRIKLERSRVAHVLIGSIGAHSPIRLVKHLPEFSPNNRSRVLLLLQKTQGTKREVREIFLQSLADRSHHVRNTAHTAFSEHVKANPLSSEEAVWLENLLTRKSSDVRRSATNLLLSQSNQSVLQSIERLYTTGNRAQQKAAKELIQEMNTAKRSRAKVRKLAERLELDQDIPDEEYARMLDMEEKPKEEDGLGLYDPAKRTPVPKLGNPISKGLRTRKGVFITPEVKAIIKDIDGWVSGYVNTVVAKQGFREQGEEELLVNLKSYDFPQVNRTSTMNYTGQFPLGETFLQWLEAYQEERGYAPVSFARAYGYVVSIMANTSRHLAARAGEGKISKLEKKIYDDDAPVVDYLDLVNIYLQFAFYGKLYAEISSSEMIDHFEELLFNVPQGMVSILLEDESRPDFFYRRSFRSEKAVSIWSQMVYYHMQQLHDEWTESDWQRYYQLLRWFDEPVEHAPRSLPNSDSVFYAYLHGAANAHDVYDLLMTSSFSRNPYGSRFVNNTFSHLSQQSPKLPKQFEFVREFVNRIRQRILEVEFYRGDLPTAASGIALSLRYAGGMEVLLKLLSQMGTQNYVRGYSYDSQSKMTVFSHLIRCTFPNVEEDTFEKFRDMVGEAKISEKRLVETAVYAPQWAAYIEYTLGWEGLESAIWWMHAHTKDDLWHVEQEIRTAWAASISRQTALDAESLLEGAVDTRWFFEVYNKLGEVRWKKLYRAAKFTSSGSGHARARLYADAMLGNLEYHQLRQRMLSKRYQDGAKAIGLLPLPENRIEQEDEILKRYRDLQEFIKTGKKYGSQRRQSEKRSVELGIENLARTAGYTDPQRMVWKIEAQEVSDLADGQVVVFADDIELTLRVLPWGDTELSIIKENGRVLKNIPTRIKKNLEVQHLLKLKKIVAAQASRMRASLEDSMVRGDELSSSDLHDLVMHPVLNALVSQLVFIHEGFLGFPVPGDVFQLEGMDDRRIELHGDRFVRIAHPYDFMQSGDWQQWQEKCFTEERIQPFKQIFRELYVLVENEKENEKSSKRYAGQQVHSRRAAGILKSRLWVTDGYSVHKTFHKEGITANVGVFIGWGTPAEVEGRSMESVWFTQKGLLGQMNLADVPPRIFSEVMRDLDLVVSVAHAGGVDPEASRSTIEMRTALVVEMLNWMKIGNVVLKDRWAMIQGERADYNIHLGSGNVHLHPGGALCVVPVHAQHRGRLFLPFADNDPKTAEIISKILLFSKDKEIKDPTILQQLI